MALLPRLRQLIRRPTTASKVGARRPTSAKPRGDTLHEDALRSMLADDPNNERAFRALAEIVRRRAGDSFDEQDPLAAAADEKEREQAEDQIFRDKLAGRRRAPFQVGQSVQINDGPFRGFFAQIAQLDDKGRVRLLLDLFNGKRLTWLSGSQVEAL